MNIDPQLNTSEQDLDKLLEHIGRDAAQSIAPPPRAILKSLIDAVDVTKPVESRYTLSKEDNFLDQLKAYFGNHIRTLVPVTIVALLLIAIGGASLYLKSSQTAVTRNSPVTTNVQPAAGSYQDIDQSLSQIDSQMSGLSDDNQAVQQSLH